MKIFVLAATLVSAAALAPGTADAAASDPAALAKLTPWVQARTAAGAEAEFLVVMAAQADLSGAARLATKAEKGRFVRDALWATAQSSQAGILEELRARGALHRPYYIVNMVWVRGDRELAMALAARPDVARVEGNPEFRVVLPREETGDAPEAIEPGVNYVRAPQVWGLGYDGTGLVVGGADTGIRWTHNALRPRYRGWNGSAADHNFNWHDSIHAPASGGACGVDSAAPCDDNGHGSHTIGTAVGFDGGTNQIGVAPGAKWIGCRNMDQGNGTPARYIECFEFFLAPYPVGGTPGQGDPTKAPDVTNNSWGCPLSEGCDAANTETLRQAVAAQRAAGIVTVASAGNSGSSCSTVDTPLGTYDESFTVGALNTGADSLASFSSRGPVPGTSPARVKPDIAAPGTGTRSASGGSDTGYASASGTSMASPHVAGAVAVLLSAFPSLDVDGVESRLTSSAFRISSAACSSTAGVYPNNLFGHGRLDLGCAVPARVTGSATVCQGGSANIQASLVGTQPWNLTWSDGLIQNGVTTSPVSRTVSPASTTTYSLTGVVNGACSQSGAGSATVTVAANLSAVSIGVVGSTTIGTPCQGGTASVTDTGGGVNAHQWGFRSVSGGAVTDIPGQTGTSYVLTCSHFPAPGMYFLVARTTPQCGGALVSNEITVNVGSVPVELQRLTIE
jgi:subtilisin family serine protease